MSTRNITTYMQDNIAKKIFTSSKVGKELAAAIISEITKIDEQELLNNLEYVHPNIASNLSTVDSETDITYEDGKKYFNIEVNRSKGIYTDNKNSGYVCQLYLKQIPNSKAYKIIKPITQINIDEYDFFNMDKLVYKCMIMETDLLLIENKNIEIYHLNILKLQKMSYTEIEKERINRILYLFTCNNEKELNKLYRGDKLMKKVKEEINKITNNADWMSLYYNQDEIDRLNRESAVNEGKVEEKIDIAKKMLKLNIDINIITSVTGLTKEEIEKIKSE